MDGYAILKKLDKLLSENLEKYSANPLIILGDFFVKLRDENIDFPSFHSSSSSVANGLSRGRFMVQNTSEAEYLNFRCLIKSSGETTRTTMILRDSFDDFSEDAEFEPDGDETMLSRTAYKLVEVPGATDWYVEDFEREEVSSEKKIRVEGETAPKKITAKFYGELDTLKPNTVVDVYGLWSEFEQIKDEVKTKMRCLHVIKYEIAGNDSLVKDFNLEMSDMACVRDILKKNLTALLGDSSSAEFLLANLLSSTYSRPGGMPICSIPVNIVGVHDSVPIISFLKSLLPMVKVLELTPDLLCNRSFASVKDFKTDELIQGELQLPNGTLLIIDETKLPDGPIPVSGDYVESNLKVLEQIILEQRIQYDFFYKVTFDVDFQLVILSNKRSRILKTPFTVPFVPNILASNGSSLDIYGLPLARKYIQLVRKNLRTISITVDTTKIINDSFVELSREIGRGVDKADLLNELLILCRIEAAAEGNGMVTEKHWKRAIKMEAERKEAMSHFNK